MGAYRFVLPVLPPVRHSERSEESRCNPKQRPFAIAQGDKAGTVILTPPSVILSEAKNLNEPQSPDPSLCSEWLRVFEKSWLGHLCPRDFYGCGRWERRRLACLRILRGKMPVPYEATRARCPCPMKQHGQDARATNKASETPALPVFFKHPPRVFEKSILTSPPPPSPFTERGRRHAGAPPSLLAERGD